MKANNYIKAVAFFMMAFLIAGAFFTFIYFYDNKYTLRAEVTQEGESVLPMEFLRKNNPIWLADGWELYPDDSFEKDSTKPLLRTYIGRHLNFSEITKGESPYGMVTYRLTMTPDNLGDTKSEDSFKQDLVLQIPEVFSAYRLLANGEEIARKGSMEPYEPSIGEMLVPISVGGDVELVLHTSNYTHYYSGLIYPPALGTAQAIGQLTQQRMIFYGILCFGSLAAALFSGAARAGTFARDRNRGGIYLYFGLLALGFASG